MCFQYWQNYLSHCCVKDSRSSIFQIELFWQLGVQVPDLFKWSKYSQVSAMAQHIKKHLAVQTGSLAWKWQEGSVPVSYFPSRWKQVGWHSCLYKIPQRTVTGMEFLLEDLVYVCCSCTCRKSLKGLISQVELWQPWEIHMHESSYQKKPAVSFWKSAKGGIH